LVYIHIYVQDLKAVYKNKTQKLCYTKKITLSLYRYVCMYASYASSTEAHVSSNARAGLVGAAPISCSAYVIGGSVYTCIHLFVSNIGVQFIHYYLYCVYCHFAAFIVFLVVSLHCIGSAYAPMWVTTFSRV